MQTAIWSLDIETSSLDKSNPQYALESFRVKQGLAQIDSIAVSGPDGYSNLTTDISPPEISSILKHLRGRTVYCHNTTFDVAWLMANTSFEECQQINWHDTMLLAKWINNSQEAQYSKDGKFSYSLKNLVKTFLPDHPLTEEFMVVKSEEHVAGQDAEYWEHRAMMDATLTRDLAKELESILPIEQFNGFKIEQQCLVYVARADLLGIHVDMDFTNNLGPRIDRAVNKMSKVLGISPSVISSPKQLGNHLFNVQGLTPLNVGKTGAGSTAASDLKMLALQTGGTDIGKELSLILDMKQLLTLKSKYVKGFNKSCEYTGENKIYPGAKIFSSYTGRFTYASKTLKKFQKSIATHQLPRKGPIKRCVIAPEDKWILKCDAAAQELRLIGVIASEDGIISEFNKGVDLHSAMAAFIANMNYEDLQKAYHAGDPDAINFRMAGKLLNLSCQYRIGVNALKGKFFDTYGIILTHNETKHYLNLYKSRYKGVLTYWDNAIISARRTNYAETLAKRRYGITQWDKNNWASESSAINMPIQGSAADHKELTLVLISKTFPELEFFLDIHDELCFYCPQDMELVNEVSKAIWNLTPKYRDIWNVDLPINLPFDSVLCRKNFKDGEEISYED